MTRRLALIITSLILMIIVVSQANAEEFKLTLDKKGRFGCLACHSDSRIKRQNPSPGEKASVAIDEKKFGKSVHKNISCMECHTDFNFRGGHFNGAPNSFKKTAGLACIRCHLKKHDKQYKEYRNSIHGKLAMTNDPRKGATCGDCHNSLGIHYIQKTKEYKAEFKLSAKNMCGRIGCHREGRNEDGEPDKHAPSYDNYSDWYHGVAYKKKVADAPACWDCHENHKIFPKEDSQSSINEENIGKTCTKCHYNKENFDSDFGLSYGKAIHGRQEQVDAAFITKIAYKGVGIKDGAFAGISSLYKTALNSIENLFKFFFPESLRPQEQDK